MEFAFATAKDEERIKQVLAACGLEHRDIKPTQLQHFLMVQDNTELTLNGVVGLEIKGHVGLLRLFSLQRGITRSIEFLLLLPCSRQLNSRTCARKLPYA